MIHTIIYKSGAKVHFEAKSMTVSRRSGQIVEVQWEDPQNRPLHVGVDEIAAVFVGKV